MRLRLVLCIMLLCLPILALGAPATFYVEPVATCAGCSDSNTCTQIKTEATGSVSINRAFQCVNAEANPNEGHTVLVGPGTYNEILRTASGATGGGYTVHLIPNGTKSGGTCTARTTLKPKPGVGTAAIIKHTTVFSGQNSQLYFNENNGAAAECIDIGEFTAPSTANGFLFDATDCSNYPSTGGACINISIGAKGGTPEVYSTTNNIRILGNTLLRGTGPSSGGACLTLFYGAVNNTIAGNTLTDCGRNEANHGIYNRMNNNIIEYNTVVNAGGYGIHSYQNGSTCSLLHTNTIRWNTVIGSAAATSEGSSAILIGGHDNQVYANNMRNNNASTYAVKVQYCTPDDNIVYNNTICGTRTNAIYVDALATDTDVQNNLIWQAGGIVNNGATTTLSKNFGCGSGCDVGVNTNPQFVNACGNTALTDSSGAIGAGNDLTVTVPTDRVGATYLLQPSQNIGAFNSGTAVSPHLLVFDTPPASGVVVNVAFDFRVSVRDSIGALQDVDSGDCTATLTQGTATLGAGGTSTTVTPVDGFCDFNLTLNAVDDDFQVTVERPITAECPSPCAVISPTFFNIAVPVESSQLRVIAIQ